VCNDKETNLSKLLNTKQNLEPQQENPSEQTDIQEELGLIEDDTKQYKSQKRVRFASQVQYYEITPDYEEQIKQKYFVSKMSTWNVMQCLYLQVHR